MTLFYSNNVNARLPGGLEIVTRISICPTVMAMHAFFLMVVPNSILCGQETEKQPRIKSVSTRGVARIHDRDFPKRPTTSGSQVNSGKASKVLQASQLLPLPKSNQQHAADIETPPNAPSLAEQDSNPQIDETESRSADEPLPDPDQVGDDPEDDDGDQVESDDPDSSEASSSFSFGNMTDRKSLPGTIQMFVSIAAISLVPAILLMTTCFIRIVVVLGILRQAIGLQQLPPTQVTTGLALMMTFLVMAPTWKEVKQNAIDPYTAEGSTMSWDEAWDAGVTPVKKFMWSQIRRAENEKDFWVFYDYLPEEEKTNEPTSFKDVPLKVLLPAFMISELKVAFLIGIQILLPFLILDIVVASLCNTMGLIMLPPAVVSLPLKLLLFVMVDGWNLVVGMLLNSFALIQV